MRGQQIRTSPARFTQAQRCLALMLSLFLLTPLGCKREKKSVNPPSKSLEVRLVHPPQLGSYLHSMLEDFYPTKPALPDGKPVSIKLIPLSAIEAANKISSGQVKTHAWLAPSTSIVNFTNSRLKNLGPKQVDCEALFATPMVLATPPKRLRLFKASKQEFSWKEAIDPYLKLSGADSGQLDLLSFSHGTPLHSMTGLPALIQMAYLGLVDSGALDTSHLEDPSKFEILKRYESKVASYGFNELLLLNNLARAKGDKLHFTITSEQQVALYNKRSTAHGRTPLIALYPSEGSYWLNHSICLSDADWVTPAQRAGVRLFTHFLSSDRAQRAILKRGFRPSVRPLSSEEPLTKNFGVDVTKAKSSLPAISGNALEHLLDNWDKLRRPSALMLILDTSGSMEGSNLRVGKSNFRNILAASSWKDLKSLMSFASETNLVSDFTLDSAEIIPQLDALQSRGGSAIYDSLKKAVDTMVRSELEGYRKIIVVYTDGDDKNSNISLISLKSLLEDTFKHYNLNLYIVAIGRDSDFEDLRSIAQSANGVFRSGGLDQMSGIFAEISSTL